MQSSRGVLTHTVACNLAQNILIAVGFVVQLVKTQDSL